MRMACPIVLTAAERSTLERWARAGAAPQRVAVRARIILLAAAGMTNGGIAAQLGVGRQTAGRWRSRFARRRLGGIHSTARPADRTPTRRDALAPLIIQRTMRTLPPNASQWTVRSLAKELGTSPTMVHRVWKANGLTPHLPPQLASGARCRVVILAHDDLARQSLTRMLGATGLSCEIDSVADGITGCFRIAECRPHLVILDLDMPRLDAADLCRSMRASPELAEARILAITRHPDSVRLRQVLEAGADDWVARSAGFRQFVAKLADLMDLPIPAAVPALDSAPALDATP